MDIFSTHTRAKGNTIYWIIGFIAVIGLVLLWSYGSQYLRSEPANENNDVNKEAASSATTDAPAGTFETGADFPIEGSDGAGAASLSQEVRTFTVHGSMFKYDVKEMRVREGEVVKIIFTNDEGFHDFVLDEFDARTEKIAAGKTVEVTFTANKKGTFEYYCSVGDHRAKGMKGTLIVE